jgi:dihydroxyacetone kinase-like protein
MPVSREDVLEWIRDYAGVIAEKNQYLTQLDAAIGDADHGANMNRGFQAVLGKLPGMADKDIGTILKTVGMTLLGTVGGAGGPLYGTFFIQAGTATAGKEEISLADWVAALDSAIQGVKMRGKAEPGDKTMIDALTPALQAVKDAAAEGKPLGEAVKLSAQAAEQGMKATIPLVARKGRASYLGERSADHQDPGATSTFLMLDSAARTWAERA